MFGNGLELIHNSLAMHPSVLKCNVLQNLMLHTRCRSILAKQNGSIVMSLSEMRASSPLALAFRLFNKKGVVGKLRLSVLLFRSG